VPCHASEQHINRHQLSSNRRCTSRCSLRATSLATRAASRHRRTNINYNIPYRHHANPVYPWSGSVSWCLAEDRGHGYERGALWAVQLGKDYVLTSYVLQYTGLYVPFSPTTFLHPWSPLGTRVTQLSHSHSYSIIHSTLPPNTSTAGRSAKPR